jgi:hypothetical protein
MIGPEDASSNMETPAILIAEQSFPQKPAATGDLKISPPGAPSESERVNAPLKKRAPIIMKNGASRAARVSTGLSKAKFGIESWISVYQTPCKPSS